jgi:hypothetical protein
MQGMTESFGAGCTRTGALRPDMTRTGWRCHLVLERKLDKPIVVDQFHALLPTASTQKDLYTSSPATDTMERGRNNTTPTACARLAHDVPRDADPDAKPYSTAAVDIDCHR